MADLLTTAQVAAILSVTPSGVARMVKRGALIPARKCEGLRGPAFFDPEDVAKLAAERADRRPADDRHLVHA